MISLHQLIKIIDELTEKTGPNLPGTASAQQIFDQRYSPTDDRELSHRKLIKSFRQILPLLELNTKEVRDAILAHPSPQELVDAAVYLHQQGFHLAPPGQQEDLIFNAKQPKEMAESYTRLAKLYLDPLSINALISLPEERTIETMNALADLADQHITLNQSNLGLLIKNDKAKIVSEALIQLKSHASDLFLNNDNIQMIVTHERPEFVLGTLKSLAVSSEKITQAMLDDIKRDSYKDWRTEKIPTFEVNRLSLSEDTFQDIPDVLKKEVEARSQHDYRESLRLMERSVSELTASYISERHQVTPPFPQGKAKDIHAGPLLQFANLYSERYLDLLKAYVAMEKKKGIPMIPVTAGQIKQHGFTSEDILKMQPVCKVYTGLVNTLKGTVKESNIYDKLVILMTGNHSKLTLAAALTLSKADFESSLKLSLTDSQYQDVIKVFKTYNDLSDKDGKDLIWKAHMLMHDFGHMSYDKISDQLDAVGSLDPKELHDANVDERLLMEIRHRIGGDSTIPQNSPGTLGANPLAYLNVVTKGEPGHPKAAFRNKMFFVYMLNHFANAVIRTDETVGEINQWLKENHKEWALDECFITTMRQRGDKKYIPPIFRYGAYAGLNTDYRRIKSDKEVEEYYTTHPNISVREAMEGSSDQNALHRDKLSDREYFNQMGELRYTPINPRDPQTIDPRTEKQLNFGTGAAIFNLSTPDSTMRAPTQEYLNTVNELHLPVCAGISGTLDQSIAMAGLVGLGTSQDLSQRQYELETMRLAYLAFMLPGSDHTVHEILQSGKTYGLPYIAGAGYEQYIYPKDRAHIEKQLQALQEKRGSALPSYFFSKEYAEKTLKEVQAESLASQKDVNAFIARLEKAKTEPLQPGLAKKLSSSDYLNVLDFFTVKDVQNLKLQLSLLKPGESCRFAKESCGLPRTVNIIRSEDGEYKLFIETKSKLASGLKDPDAPVIRGAIKTEKASWRLDVQEEYFGLTMTVDAANPQQRAYVEEKRRESNVSRLLAKDSENICETELGVEFEKDGKKKITVYSPRALGTLDKFLTDEISTTVKEKLISDLLKGIKAIHDKGYVHQDLKPENLLIYDDGQGGYLLKIANFGACKKHQAHSEYGSGPHQYQSPELAYFYTNPHSTNQGNKDYGEKYYHERLNILGRLVADAPQNAEVYTAGTKDRDQYKTPDKSNDMWAVGMLIHYIQHGRIPESVNDINQIQDDPLLQGLLSANRATRINIDTAIERDKALTDSLDRNFDTKEPGRRYYIGVDLHSSPEDLAPDAREKLGDDISQYLTTLSIDELKAIDRDRWHMTVGWLENINSEHTPISEETYQKILPHIESIISKYKQLQLTIIGFSPNTSNTGLHADFAEKTGQLDALRQEIKNIVARIAPDLQFKTAWPHALVAYSAQPFDRSKIKEVHSAEIYQVANMSMMYYDEQRHQTITTQRFATSLSTSSVKTVTGATSHNGLFSQSGKASLEAAPKVQVREEDSEGLGVKKLGPSDAE